MSKIQLPTEAREVMEMSEVVRVGISREWWRLGARRAESPSKWVAVPNCSLYLHVGLDSVWQTLLIF